MRNARSGRLRQTRKRSASTCTVHLMARTTLRASLLVASLATASVAASSAPRFSKPTTPTMPRIVVVTPAGTDYLSIRTEFDAATLVPWLGTVAAVSRDSAAKSAVGKQLRAEGLDLPKRLQADLLVALLGAGYAVDTATISRKPGGQFAVADFLTPAEYPAVSDVFAFLDVRIRAYGFFAVSSTSQYRATLQVDARIVDAATKRTLYERRFVYQGPPDQWPGMLKVAPASAQPTWASLEDIKAQPTVAAEALRLACSEVASAIANELK
jgi:hypothetical protein